MLTDLDEAGLREYRSAYEAPADFDEFWRRTLDGPPRCRRRFGRSRRDGLAHDRRLRRDLRRLRGPSRPRLAPAAQAPDARRGRRRDRPLPGVVQFHGYGSGRGHALDDLLWASAGYAHLLMDARGQGGGYAGGETGDPVGSAGPTSRDSSPVAWKARRPTTTGGSSSTRYAPSKCCAATRRRPVTRRRHRQQPGRRHRARRRRARPDAVAALYAQAPFLCDIRRPRGSPTPRRTTNSPNTWPPTARCRAVFGRSATSTARIRRARHDPRMVHRGADGRRAARRPPRSRRTTRTEVPSTSTSGNTTDMTRAVPRTSPPSCPPSAHCSRRNHADRRVLATFAATAATVLLAGACSAEAADHPAARR